MKIDDDRVDGEEIPEENFFYLISRIPEEEFDHFIRAYKDNFLIGFDFLRV